MADASEGPHRTALYDRHIAAGAEMAVEDGWEMPRSYGDVEAECRDAHARAAAFDLSHVGRIRIRGEGALDMLDRLCTADVARQEDDTARYTLLLNERGGIIDHAMLVRLEDRWLLTCSPQRRQAVLEHLRAHAEAFGAKVEDETPKTAMIGVAGPAAPAILDAVLPERVSTLPRGAVRTGSFLVARYVAMRIGATALWSLEVILPNLLAAQAWRFITDRAGANAIRPAGLAARDALRVEAGLPRWGRGLDEHTDPVAAGLERAVDLAKNFLGAQAVRGAKRHAGG